MVSIGAFLIMIEVGLILLGVCFGLSLGAVLWKK